MNEKEHLRAFLFCLASELMQIQGLVELKVEKEKLIVALCDSYLDACLEIYDIRFQLNKKKSTDLVD